MNKKAWVSTLVALMLISTAVFAWGGKSGDGDATGEITQLKVRNPNATVTGITRNGNLWLAYTVYWNDGTEGDYEPIRVGTGKFTKTISWSAMHPEGLHEVIVCLWRHKVSSSRCAKDNGEACQYCKKNGFHMEGRMDRQTGS